MLFSPPVRVFEYLMDWAIMSDVTSYQKVPTNTNQMYKAIIPYPVKYEQKMFLYVL